MATTSSGDLAKSADSPSARAKANNARQGRGKRGQVGPEQVAEAAAKLFREKGYHGTSMQDIADAVGIHKGSLYPHIRSKDALLYQVINGSLQTTTQQLEIIAESSMSPFEKLREAVEGHIHSTVAHRDRIAVLLEASKYLSPARRRSALKQQRRYESLIERILEEGVLLGQFRPCDAKVITFAILGMGNWVYRWYSPKGKLAIAELARVFAEFALCGVVVPSADAGLSNSPQVDA
ncbi:MAG: TetR/AcrR family transcriptional regulator, partial [Dehalococcoidia bacterium]|nr:TetR/AcrR family transcriptional regulator [Dehalococcoidia bacterium]